MALTSQTRRWHWIQVALLMALGALAAVSATFGQDAASSQQPEAAIVVPSPQDGQESATPYWPEKRIANINIDPHDPSEQKPEDRSAALVNNAAAEHWFNSPHPTQYVYWTAPNIWYQPLYFEDVALERYGQSIGHWDPARSAVLFFGDLAAFPVNLIKRSPHSCDYPLGYARPGSCAPNTRHQFFYHP